MDYKNLAEHSQPKKTNARLLWLLVLLTPIFIAALLLVLVPQLTAEQKILVILCSLFVLLGAQLYRMHKEYKQHVGSTQSH
ncbi:hypothetical protein [Catenovulum adriaticum]|uniref:Uncharacterized protein n=1 Tax=Catenovulum adriaticum TaxID=2984846 RepID=A0ABY7ATH3_9ALTE|nr:hypothetical protein [Catenovulum sp. TS8]WAJ72072.1 hypothetical protein OLW01_17480 [Catenovulum sp. TS8]